MSANLARKLDEVDAFQVMGKVLRAEGPVYVVRTDRGDFRARRATSCLVAPREADFVLIAGAPSGAAYVLAVLEREEGAGVEIVSDGDLSLEAPGGRVSIAAGEGIDLATARDVSVVSEGVNVHAEMGNIVLDKLSYLGAFVRSEIGKLRQEGGVVERVLDRVTDRVKRSFRKVEEIDHVDAKLIDYAAKQALTMRAKNAVVVAEELVKMDGEQIHLG